MEVLLRVRRFNPEVEKKAYWAEYKLTDVKRMDRVLDLLHHVKWYIDGTLTLRRSCRRCTSLCPPYVDAGRLPAQ